MWNCMSGFGLHSWGMGAVLFLLLFGLLTFAVLWAANERKQRRNHVKDRQDSLEIVKIRLARGEIGVEEFERLKLCLQGRSPKTPDEKQ